MENNVAKIGDYVEIWKDQDTILAGHIEAVSASGKSARVRVSEEREIHVSYKYSMSGKPEVPNLETKLVKTHTGHCNIRLGKKGWHTYGCMHSTELRIPGVPVHVIFNQVYGEDYYLGACLGRPEYVAL